MTLLIITEKPSLMQIFSNVLENNPDDYTKYFSKYDSIEVISTMGFGLYSFDYPNTFKYKDYPLTLPIKTKFKSFNEYSNNSYKTFYQKLIINENYIIEEENYNNGCPIKNYKYILKDESKYYENEKMISKKFDDLLFYVDPDNAGTFYAEQLLKNIYGEKWKNEFNNIYFADLMKAYGKNNKKSKIFEDAFIKQNEGLNKLKNFSRQASIKYYLDYNYNLNSIVFTGEIIKNQLIKNEKKLSDISFNYMSKYVVMTYLMLLEKSKNEKIKNRFTEFMIINFMEKYSGSGKYNKNEDLYKYLMGIGTPASKWPIIQNLIELGFIEKIDKNRQNINIYRIIDNEYFVKKMFDPDLPFRLINWMNSEKSIEEIYKEIDNYIISMFSRQKEKNNKMFYKSKIYK